MNCSSLPEPMLARSGRLPTGRDWNFEVKWDGFRAIASTEGPLRVRSRRGSDMTDRAAFLSELPVCAVLDGEHVALLSADAAILLLCLARPELAERRPTWPVALRLEPLGEAEVDELLPESVPADLRAKTARAAGGNPLFVREMVAMATEAAGEVAVPPTLQALLAARLDELERGERSVLERGAIEGEIFHRGAVQALAPVRVAASRSARRQHA